MSTLTLSPYRNEAYNKMYDLLFCDDLSLYRPADNLLHLYPWNVLYATSPRAKDLIKLTQDKNLESRIRLLAHRALNKKEIISPQRELLAVITEVGMEDGLDTLAAYSDGTARFISYAEKVIVWETKTTESNRIIDELFATSLEVVNKIGPWDKPRLGPPQKADIRLSFLLSDGLYFGQGPLLVLSKDAMGGPVVNAATKLLVFLTERGHG